jgi:hypothetical protein
VIIKIERSGGITGVFKSNILDSKDLPITILTTLEKIMEHQTSCSTPQKKTPPGAADYYTYKISMKQGGKEKIMKFNQFNMSAELKSIIRYVENVTK